MTFHSFPFAPLVAALALSLPAVMAACSAGRAAITDPITPGADEPPIRRLARPSSVADIEPRARDAGRYGIVILRRQAGGDIVQGARRGAGADLAKDADHEDAATRRQTRRVWIKLVLQPDAALPDTAQHPGWRDKMAD